MYQQELYWYIKINEKGKGPLWNYSRSWEDDIKMDIKASV